MKVVKASMVNPTDDGFICYLSRQEAEFIRGVAGCVGGGGFRRDIADEMYQKLGAKSVACINPFTINSTAMLKDT